VQDNHSRSAKGVLRGLHYQIEHAQGKLVRVVKARCSTWRCRHPQELAEFRQVGGRESVGREPSAIVGAAGFAHGFVVLSESAQFLYKTTDYWYPNTSAASSGTIRRSALNGRSTSNRCCGEGCGG
jgi:dTDP-4-dehydrorhamnose 3,5-epimerase